MRREREKEKRYLWIFIGIAVLIHLILQSDFGDDLIFGAQLEHKAVLPWLIHRYHSLSSRFLVEISMAAALKVPVLLWKAADTVICILLGAGLNYLLDNKGKNAVFTAALLCVYPFMHMGSAGWRVTTANYLWPLAAGIGCLVLFKKFTENEKLSVAEYILYIAGLLYAANLEQMAIVLAGCLCLLIICYRDHKKAAALLIAGLLSVIGNLVFILSNPGNSVRVAKEIHDKMPEFIQLTFVDKLRLGFVSIFQHFTVVPNFILFIFCLLLILLAADRKFRGWKFAAAWVPMGLNIIYSLYFLADIIRKRSVEYTEPRVLPENAGQWAFQIAMGAAFLIFIICVIFVCVEGLRDSRDRLLVISGFLIGGATRMALAFTPTMFASSTRTYLFLYMAFIIGSAVIYKRIQKVRFQWMLNAAVVFGILMNLGGIVMLQMKY
ncbi:DUF6056 family protein [Anaerostipes sp.]|uniref:DUF6056 family protein n=1 Tax=Anaerostipes sp. TaxID=1872530 RepID=UPI0025C667AC|nr:DUF6056 family protein [Anaerostipes sp.]MBS7008871.1 hypothetical protein [Anaerostipes sp.]